MRFLKAIAYANSAQPSGALLARIDIVVLLLKLVNYCCLFVPAGLTPSSTVHVAGRPFMTEYLAALTGTKIAPLAWCVWRSPVPTVVAIWAMSSRERASQHPLTSGTASTVSASSLSPVNERANLRRV